MEMKWLNFLSNEKMRLFQLSFLMLFIEMAIIRWSSSNIIFLFFFANFVLIASFLGIGLGFLNVSSSRNFFKFSPLLLMIVVFSSYYFSYEYQAKLNPITDNLNYRENLFTNNFYPIWLTLPIIFIMVTALMASIADGVASSFEKFSPLQAYRLEILGSLSGILLFAIFSYWQLPPLFWGLIICLLYLSLLIPSWRIQHLPLIFLQVSALIIVMFTFSFESKAQDYIWSAYYKISLQKYAGDRYAVNVNGLAQQIIESVQQRQKVKPFYFLPYEHRSKQTLDKVLVIGAGTGGDVAIALLQGANEVDAVEIDPALYRLGKKLNPNHPYEDPRVHIYIDDGRAFLQHSTKKYDMIIFALTDSLMLIPGQSTLRLENFLYTLESIETVFQHLKSNGTFTIYNYYHPEWFVDRLARTLTTIFKHPPCLDTYSEKDYWATVLTVSPGLNLQCPKVWQEENQAFANPATDNHPFVYLQENKISMDYWFFIIFISLITLWSVKKIMGSFNPIKHYLDFFLMGAAFLLLETKNIINFALLFGTTWLVNAMVFLGMLTVVYLAIEVAHYVKTLSIRILYLLLILSLIFSWVVPNHYLLGLPVVVRFISAIIILFTPIFIANLIFSQRFRDSHYSRYAFGANLIGAVLGGLLEYSAIIFGYQLLILFAIILYTLAVIYMRPAHASPA